MNPPSLFSAEKTPDAPEQTVASTASSIKKLLVVGAIAVALMFALIAGAIYEMKDAFEPILALLDLYPPTSSEHVGSIGGRLMSTGLLSGSSASSEENWAIIGNTYQSTASASPRLGVKFIDASQADILADGVKIGGTRNYTVHGNTITIPTSCSVLCLQIQGDQLLPDALHCPLAKQ